MALQDALLAALSGGESSGYDLSKAFDVTVANFWTATPQQLYRELEKMQAAGLIEARIVEQVKRPNKRLFTLTASGRAALRDFTTRAPKPTAIRDELLVQIEAMDLADADAIKVNLRAKLEASEAKLRHYQRARAYLLDGKSERAYLSEEDRLGPYLTLARGISFEQETIRWCEFVLATLAERSTAESTPDSRPARP